MAGCEIAPDTPRQPTPGLRYRIGRGASAKREPLSPIICRKDDALQETRGGAEVFAVPRPNNIVNLPVTINGTRGTFVLDTGATFVSLQNSFAQKAGVKIDRESVVHLRTANGIVEGKRGRAQTIQLRSLLAKDVPIVVQAGEYGAGIDGLLGMSFLSRFTVNIDAKTVRISPRTAALGRH